MSRVFRGSMLVGLLVVFCAGCKSDGGDFVTPPPLGDGGIRDRVQPDMPKAPNQDGSSEKIIGGDGAAGDVTVTIINPMDDGVVKLADRFVPVVEVAVTSVGGLEDPVKEVTAEIFDEKGLAVSTVKLALSMKTPAADMTAIYRYAETPMDLAAFKSAVYTLRAKATTEGGSGHEAVVTFKGDAGPIIVVASPMADKAFKGSLSANVKITDPLFMPIKDVTMSVGDVEVVPSGPSPSGDYTATFDFSSFIPPLSGMQLFKVRARNANDTLAEKTVPFKVDDEGPEITGTQPEEGEIIGHVITVRANVTDPSGVIASSVHAVIAHGDDKFEITLTGSGSVFEGKFDTSLLPLNALFPTISFRASDTLGNESALGYIVTVDNVGPLGSMRRTVYRMVRKTEEAIQCAHEDPALGGDMPIDGEVVNQLFPVRARIEDRANSVLAGPTPFAKVSGIDPTTVQVYVLDDTDQALMVDTDGNGVCDAVNPNLQPTSTPMSSKDLLKIGMGKVGAGGTADFTPDESVDTNFCESGDEMMSPDFFCKSAFAPWKIGRKGDTGLTLVPPTNEEPPDSALWGLPPIASGLECLGTPFDAYANHINDGWVCLGVSMADMQTNASVSVPLRLCVDIDGDGAECPHRHLKSATSPKDQPIEVETATPHGFSNGDTVVISRAYPISRLDGQWQIEVIDDTHFRIPDLLGGGSVPTNLPAEYMPGIPVNFVIGLNELPDCTGTQVSAGPPAEIDQGTPCVGAGDFGYYRGP